MKTEIREELKEIATTLAGIGNANCYRVPDHYFDDFASEVLSKIQLPATQMPFTQPSPSYFEGLAGEIMSKIKSNGIIVEEKSEVEKELATISPLVAGIKKENVYTVPAHYFANFNVTIPTPAQRTNVVGLHRPIRWMRYAAAAVVVGVVAVSGFFVFQSNNSAVENTPFAAVQKTLSAVSNDAIANYLNEIPADIDITPASYDDTKINAGSLAEQLLNDISDSDIQKYLQENQQTGEKDIKGI